MSLSRSKGFGAQIARYEVEDEEFAAGCFGKVMLGRDGQDNQVVIKKIPKNQSEPTEVDKEVRAGMLLRHPLIANFRDHVSNDDHDFLIFDRVHGSDLYTIIERGRFNAFKEFQAKRIFGQILKAIRFSHKNEVVHRDIKLENILMDSTGKITVIDFGLCDHVARGQLSEKFCGSLDYVAPEVLGRSRYDGYQADVFSLGVVLFTLLFAEFPYAQKERTRSIKLRQPHPCINFSLPRLRRWGVSEEAQSLINMMVNPNPLERITLDEVKNHPWMQHPAS